MANLFQIVPALTEQFKKKMRKWQAMQSKSLC